MRLFVYLLTISLMLSCLQAEELTISADSFSGNEKLGISVFEGNVKIKKGFDELNATRVEVLLNSQKQPVKYTAQGDVSIKLKTDEGSVFSGVAQKVIFLPIEQEYRFYQDVELKQLDELKQISGDEVVVNIKNSTATAKGDGKKPIMMVFDLPAKSEAK